MIEDAYFLKSIIFLCMCYDTLKPFFKSASSKVNNKYLKMSRITSPVEFQQIIKFWIIFTF